MNLDTIILSIKKLPKKLLNILLSITAHNTAYLVRKLNKTIYYSKSYVYNT